MHLRLEPGGPLPLAVWLPIEDHFEVAELREERVAWTPLGSYYILGIID